jgi:hypothetical protein
MVATKKRMGRPTYPIRIKVTNPRSRNRRGAQALHSFAKLACNQMFGDLTAELRWQGALFAPPEPEIDPAEIERMELEAMIEELQERLVAITERSL